MLESLTTTWKFNGWNEVVTLALRSKHMNECPYNNFIRCIAGCGIYDDDLVRHLINQHDYKEIIMEESGGMRSFSGPFDSWVRDTEWPRGIWWWGGSPIIVHARTVCSVFHIYLYTVSKSVQKITLQIEAKDDYVIKYTGIIPHARDYFEKVNAPHFNCDTEVLLNHFVKVHEEDEEILRLWVKVQHINNLA